jgi:hypothetical protein
MKTQTQEAVAVKTRINGGSLTNNHSEAVVVKTRVNGGLIALL